MAKKVTVATPCQAYRRQEAWWAPCVALMGGTQAMRAAGRTYLPQFPKESDAAYNLRLQRSTLYPAFATTARRLSARPFREPVQLNDDLSPSLLEITKNVDLCGSSLTVFAKGLLRDCLVYGRAHILVEFPNTGELRQRLGRRQLSVADQQQANVRTYWLRVNPEAIIGWEGYVWDASERLQCVRLLEESVEPDPDNPWGEVVRQRVRVYYPDRVEVYECQGKEWPDRPTAEPVPLTLGQIPLVTIYGNVRESLLEARPPLQGLADLNIKHWQGASDSDTLMQAIRSSFLQFAGYTEEQMSGQTIGPFRAVFNPSPDAKVSAVEQSAAGWDASHRDLETLKEEMAAQGDDMLVRRPGNETATARAIDAGEAVSDLQAAIENVRDGLEEGLRLTARWQDLPKPDRLPIHVAIPGDDPPTQDVKGELSELRELYDRSLITAERYLQEAKRRGLLDDDMDVEAELAEAREQPFPGSRAPEAEDEEEDEDEEEPAADPEPAVPPEGPV